MARKTKQPPAPEPITIDVRLMSNFAFNAGLSHGPAEELILATPDEDCRIKEGPCPSGGCNGTITRHLLALGAFEGRDLIYCEDCGEVDIWV
jgi:hypothetical protein